MKKTSSIKKFITGGGWIALAFAVIFLVMKFVQGSDTKYEVQHRTHYQDKIDRVLLCESPASNFHHTPAIGWIVGIVALAILTILLIMYANDKAPGWFEKRSNPITGGLMLVVLIFMFALTKYNGTECKERTEKEYQQGVKDMGEKGYLDSQFN